MRRFSSIHLHLDTAARVDARDADRRYASKQAAINEFQMRHAKSLLPKFEALFTNPDSQVTEVAEGGETYFVYKVTGERLLKTKGARDSKRLIDTISDGSAQVKVYYDSELEEYCCKLYVGGAYRSNADYFTNDKSDALDTARAMARKAV
jgi:hypothetical protein